MSNENGKFDGAAEENAAWEKGLERGIQEGYEKAIENLEAFGKTHQVAFESYGVGLTMIQCLKDHRPRAKSEIVALYEAERKLREQATNCIKEADVIREEIKRYEK